MPDPFDPTSYEAAPPFDPQTLMQGPGASAPAPSPAVPQGFDKRKLLRLLPVVLAAAKGGPGLLEGVLHGYQQADARRRQQATQDAATQRQERLDTENQQYRQATLANQQAQFQQQTERQREADRRALVNDVRSAVGSVTSAEAVRALLPLYAGRAQALGIPIAQLEAFILESATPTVLQQREATERLDALRKQYGSDAHNFKFVVPGEANLVPFEELERRAGFQRDPEAPPRGQQPQGTLTEFEAFFTNDYLPAVLEERTAAGQPDRLTRQEIADLKIQARQEWTGAGRAPRAGRQQTVSEERQQESRLDEQMAYLLRNPSGASRQKWQQIRNAYEQLGVEFQTRRDSVARRVEREDRQDPYADMTSAAERIAASEAAITGSQAPSPAVPPPAPGPGGRGRGAGPSTPPAGQRTATRAQVEAVAAQRKVTYAEAKRELEARGVRVTN